MPSNSSLKLPSGLLALIGVLHIQRVYGERNCPTSFHFLHEIYKACAPNHRSRARQFVPLTNLRQVTGGDIIVELQRMCTSLPRLRRCSATSLEGCPTPLQQIYQSAVDESMWFCDANNNIKGSITRALTGTVSVPGYQRTRANCVADDDLDECPSTLIGLERFRRIQDYGSIIQHDAVEVLADPMPMKYFHELLDCYASKVLTRCPLNVLPMVLADQYHLISPPKFGFNISGLIINKAAELQNY